MSPRSHHPRSKPRSRATGAPGPRWNREQIRAARLAPLAPLLQARGLPLRELEADNFESTTHPGLLLKEHYWRWPERGQAGNTIDFFVQILGMSFDQAMRQITAGWL